MDSEIRVDVSNLSAGKHISPTQYEEWVARFCYAAAAIPAETVEHILSIMELSSEANSTTRDQ